MDQIAVENVNKAMQEMTDWAMLFDSIHNSITKTAQEAQRESVLTPDHEISFLKMSGQLSKQKAAMNDMKEALEITKEKAMQGEETDLKQFYQQKLSENKGKRRDKQVEDEFGSRLKAILQGNTAAATERMIDQDTSLVLDEDNTQLTRKCPITQLDIVNPYRNRKCGHVFERDAVLKYIRDLRRQGGSIRCPTLACSNKNISEKDFVTYVFPD